MSSGDVTVLTFSRILPGHDGYFDGCLTKSRFIFLVNIETVPSLIKELDVDEATSQLLLPRLKNFIFTNP